MASLLHLTRRFFTPAALVGLTACTLGCGPKVDHDDGGDDSSGSAGTTTTGEAVTSSDSDPTSPGTSPNPTTANTSGGSDTATTASTAASTTGVVTSGDPTATATATSTVTSDSDEPPPIDPPVPCAGAAVPLVGVEAQAFLKSQIPPDPNTSGSSGGSGGEPDPATLYVRLSDQKATCSDPQGNLECGAHWDVLIAIPPEFQAPGLFNLLGQDVSAGASESGPDNGGGDDDCAFGGGSFAATFEIVAIDDTSVEGRLCNVDDFFTFVDPQLEGSFVAPRCP